ncbi:MAG: WXG100 family type VII secretion target, partial [Anaerolineae bacterium]
QQSLRALQSGGWEGRGAAAFFGEMSSEVLPALNRLGAALQQAQQVTRQISSVLRAAEEEASQPFRGSSQAAATPQPRIYIVNGINSAGNVVTVDAAGNIVRGDDDSVALERLLETHGYDPNSVVSTPAIYIHPTGTNLTGTNFTGTNYGGWLSPVDWLTGGLASATNTATGFGADAINTTTDALLNNMAVGSAVGATQVLAEYQAGAQGPFTQQTLAFINEDLRTHPLLPGQTVILMGHSGGGAVVGNLAGELERAAGVDVSGVVTMGSPVSNYDAASRYAEQIVQVRHQDDLIGTPIIRTNESRWTLPFGIGPTVAAETLGRDVGDHPNVTYVTLNNPVNGTLEAHGSYMTSIDMLQALNRQFPELHLDVNR